MDIHALIHAKKYARAFMNVYGQSISHDTYHKLILLHDYLCHQKSILLYFNLPHLPTEKKLGLLSRIGAHLESVDPLKKLCMLLIEHRQCHLMPSIIEEFCKLYRQNNAIRRFEIQSSSILSEADLTCIKEFLACKTGCTIEYTSSINHQLIAGLRLKSDTLLWEYSVSKQIKELRKAFALSDELLSHIEERSHGN